MGRREYREKEGISKEDEEALRNTLIVNIPVKGIEIKGGKGECVTKSEEGISTKFGGDSVNMIEREGKFTIEGNEEKNMEGKPGERNLGAIPM